jgi:prepilin-type N-terminal cleavage/methylation domain-containing protein
MESKKKKFATGFTIIELIVVIAIIAVLTAIILTNVTQYIGKSKIARANADVQNIQKALTIFYTQYSDYPYSNYFTILCPEPYCDTEFAGSNNADVIPSDPYLTDSTGTHHLSDFYNFDYNADFFVKNGYYHVWLEDMDLDGKIGCGMVSIFDLNNNFYGSKFIICQDCPENCDGSSDIPFSISPYVN